MNFSKQIEKNNAKVRIRKRLKPIKINDVSLLIYGAMCGFWLGGAILFMGQVL